MEKWLPHNVSTYGGEIDSLFVLIYWITGVVFLLVAATLLAFLVIYRDKKDGRRATYSHGNNTLEIVWTIIPALVFVMLAVMSASAWSRIKIHPPPADVVVQLTAKQFNWTFTYPGPDGKIGTGKTDPAAKDDKSDDNILRVPVHKVVHVRLVATDVIHSFFVPNLRLKQDLVPGRELMAWFEATEPGKYEIACAELCGFGHTTMQGWLEVLTPEDYDKWVAKKWNLAPAVPPPAAPVDGAAVPPGASDAPAGAASPAGAAPTVAPSPAAGK